METIKGKLVKGTATGKKLGFPTLNLQYVGNLRGVFAGQIFIEDIWHKAAINIGGRPTFGDEKVFCEVHVFNWDGAMEDGTELEVKILKKIREIQKFDSIEQLKKQIARDVEIAKKELI